MKYLLNLLVLLCCFSCLSKAQDTIPAPPPIAKTPEDAVFTRVEVEASFRGGEAAWRKYLSGNLNIDKVARKVRIPKGETEFRQTIIVKFVVNKKGEISNVSVENEDANRYCIEEAIRVIEESPNWIPAQQNGRIVNAYRRQPITFLFTR